MKRLFLLKLNLMEQQKSKFLTKYVIQQLLLLKRKVSGQQVNGQRHLT